MEKTAVTLCGKKLNIVRPRFYFSFNRDIDDKIPTIDVGAVNDAVAGGTQYYNCWLPENHRHISIAELTDLLADKDDNEEHFKKRRILAEIFLDYILTRGIDTETHDWKHGLWVSEGVRREGQNLIVFKNIDGKLESVTEPMYDTIEGYQIKGSGERFSLERLFRRYGEELAEIEKARREVVDLRERKERGEFIENSLIREAAKKLKPEEVTLKQIDKSNPDLIEYLFLKEFEQLPKQMQEARFRLPPDTSGGEEHREYSIPDEINIWPLSLDISLNFLPADKIFGPSIIKKISRLALQSITMSPYQLSGGTHVIVENK